MTTDGEQIPQADEPDAHERLRRLLEAHEMSFARRIAFLPHQVMQVIPSDDVDIALHVSTFADEACASTDPLHVRCYTFYRLGFVAVDDRRGEPVAVADDWPNGVALLLTHIHACLTQIAQHLAASANAA